MANSYTAEQQAAIDAKGKTIVSASAGSGKTTVMIEKILGILKDGGEISQILAVTYTKKAAAQMREKLRGKIVKELANPELSSAVRTHLKAQLAGIAVSDVSTIHSFCSRLIKTHFFAAGIESGFSVISAEDSDGKVLQARALDEVFEEAYENKEEDFYKLLSVYYRKKNDEQLRQILINTYNDLRARDDYIEYLQRSQELTEQDFTKICEELRQIHLVRLQRVAKTAEEAVAYFTAQKEKENEEYRKQCEERVAQNKKPLVRREKKGSLPLALEALEYLQQAFKAEDLFALARLQGKFSSKESGTMTEEYQEQVERLASAVEEIKTVKKKLAKLGDRKEELDAFLKAGEIGSAIAKYLLKFDEAYKAQKRERGVLDYNDLEHIALELLSQEDISTEMRAKYRFIFVDEYQDVNPVQEKIIRRLAGENVFLVGDMKQAIYAFRGSKSVYFKKTWEEYKKAEDCNALQLPHNFRSRAPILNAVNEQFALSMTEAFCGVDYKTEGEMRRGANYGENSNEQYDGYVRVHFLGKKKKGLLAEEENEEARGVYSVRESAEKTPRRDTSQIQAVVRLVKSIRGQTFYDNETGSLREAEYADIAILTRWNFGRTSQLASALSEAGVPVVSESPVNLFAFSEIQTLTDILRLVDNAEQDIPLCSALLSALGGLTENDLAKIRLAYPVSEFYFFRDACKAYALQKEDGLSARLKGFYAYLAELRRKSCLLSAGELLVKILSETGLEASLLASHGGQSCLGRINRFLAEAEGGEGLNTHEFLERLRMLEYKIDYSEGGGEGCVRIMSMHASKGLEFPFVIVDDLNKTFHAVDKAPVMIEEEYGLAPYAYDSEKMLVRTTVHREFCYERKLAERAKDELNLYYVALTRAKYGLHLIFDEEKQFNLHYASSMAELTAFLVWAGYIAKDEGEDLPTEERQVIAIEADEGLRASLQKSLAWKYSHTGCENLPVKSSATALMKGLGEAEEYVAPLKREGKTSVDEGLAYHAFLERWEFAFEGELLGAVVGVLENMRAEGGLAEEYAKLLQTEKLVEILSLPVFKRLTGKILRKECKFLAAIPAKDALALQGVACEGQEELLFQGAIDLLAEGEDEWEIVDYKYSRRGAEELSASYAPQLALYKKAVAKITGAEESKIRCTIVNIYRGFELAMV